MAGYYLLKQGGAKERKNEQKRHGGGRQQNKTREEKKKRITLAGPGNPQLFVPFFYGVRCSRAAGGIHLALLHSRHNNLHTTFMRISCGLR